MLGHELTPVDCVPDTWSIDGKGLAAERRFGGWDFSIIDDDDQRPGWLWQVQWQLSAK